MADRIFIYPPVTSSRIRILSGMVLLICLCRPCLSQDPVPFGQHGFNRLGYNPAFAGERGIPGFSLLSRQQWPGWPGSPTLNTLVTHTKLRDKQAGAAMMFSYEGMGPVHGFGLTGAYSYTLEFDQDRSLSLGMQVELAIRQIRLSQLELIDQGDLLFATDPGNHLQPNAGVGARYILDGYTLFLSVPRLLNSKLSPFEGESSKWSTTSRVVYLGGTTTYGISDDINLDPSLLLAFSRGHSVFAELAVNALYRERFGAGAFFRLNKTIGAMVRYKYQQRIVIGYAYDVSFNATSYNAGTHELFLGYNFPFNESKVLSPRRF